MLFNSLQYLILFLPVAWIGYRLFGRMHLSTAQLLWLVACSLFFYASWNPVYIFLIVASVATNFLFGRWLSYDALRNRRSQLLFVGVSFNLGLLGYYKYTGFFLDNLNQLAGTLIPIPEVTLPLAISFFTFQQIAYLVDVYRGESRDYSFSHYCLFVTFFPQLIAGPIVHHKEMMPQFDAQKQRGPSLEDFQVGITIIALGLFKKIIFADNLALMSDPLFAQAEAGTPLSLAEAWVAVLAFTGQIYFDFSGYTDIAIGSARLFGIRLPENFFSPYKSGSIIEFWRRWHITLSRFLRDYLYISLGGNRRGSPKRYRNLFLTMLLGGLWHGAHWNFVMWGGLHGGYLVINHFWRHLARKIGLSDEPGLMLSSSYRLLTLLAVMVAWVFFRAESIGAANSILLSMLDISNMALRPEYFQGLMNAQPGFQLAAALLPAVPVSTFPLAVLGIALAVSLWAPNTQQFMGNYKPALEINRWPAYAGRILWRPSVGYAIGVAFLCYLALLGIGSESEFIYFQF